MTYDDWKLATPPEYTDELCGDCGESQCICDAIYEHARDAEVDDLGWDEVA